MEFSLFWVRELREPCANEHCSGHESDARGRLLAKGHLHFSADLSAVQRVQATSQHWHHGTICCPGEMVESWASQEKLESVCPCQFSL
jgi:ferredoxin-thioredoxin reductase catalytic subunit